MAVGNELQILRKRNKSLREALGEKEERILELESKLDRIADFAAEEEDELDAQEQGSDEDNEDDE